MEQFKDAYEISLWGDVYKNAEGATPAHYEEEKIGVIGSDLMTAQWRAVEPKLTQNVNGTNTFTFKMFYTYIDTITGERKDNPFQNLLVNERKVKVKWKNKWYDFVIKSCQEDSSGKSVTYTCQDQFINELSKTGFNLEFDNELGNNMGTAQELAQTVLDGTDWQLGENQDTIKQYREEPVYDITRNGIRFLVFYSVVQNHEAYFQYWYDSSNQYTRDGTSMLVVNGECKSTTASWSEDTATVTIEEHSMEIDFAPLNVSDDYRAERLVRSQETAYCPPLDRYVNKYTYIENNVEKIAYGYQTTTYNDPTLITNYMVNGSGFTSTLGWTGSNISWNINPPYDQIQDETAITNYLIVPKSTWVQNSTLYDYRYNRFKTGLLKGEKLVLRIKAKTGSATEPTSTYITSGLSIRISSTNSGGINYITPTRYSYGDGWINYLLTCNSSCAYDNLINSSTPVTLRFSYTNSATSVTHLWIEEIQLFDYVLNDNNQLLIPGQYDVNSVVKTEWRYFNESELSKVSEENMIFLESSDESLSSYSPVYPEGEKAGEKIRSIAGKNSNRFNWLQTIAETFECWVKFDIEHNPSTGELIYEGGVPKKYITFVQDIGVETGLSFVYGIDLNTISRTINSDQIATKVIVSPNSNEFGKDGFCTIARASENYSKSNFILDFGYYINQGMLSSRQINLDLYDPIHVNGIGYYHQLNNLNTQFDKKTEEIVDLKGSLDRYTAQQSQYEKLIESTKKEISSTQTRLMQYAGLTGAYNNTKVVNYIKANSDRTEVKTLYATLNQLKENQAKYESIKTDIDNRVNSINTEITTKESEQETISNQIKSLDEQFNTKYARFIQEGSWISEDYYDDNLYYLDAESVAYTSSRPQIQYNINVLRLSALEEFKNKIFNVGDRGYVEDTEFFGYAKDVNGNITNTPYKEEILISEITSVFDSPEQDTITVQNYKTQFEDLFQRITATTQSLQYNEGGYARAASIVEPTGEINSWTLEKSFAYNENLAWRAKDDSIVIDTTGITAIDMSNPQYMVRLSSAGIQISNDGGVSWRVGISGEGISTQNLTAGNINTDTIQILSGSYPTFNWNKYGLNAYYYTTNQSGTIDNVWSNKFVRFDRFGLYGIDNNTQSLTETVFNNENEIWNAAQYALTWKGFMLKTEGGAVTITSEDDISVWDNQQTPQNRVKIGRISGQGTSGDPYVYGIRISDASGTSVMESDSDGKLWIRDKLHIGTNNSNYNVGIGNLGIASGETLSQVINANDNFIVYEDGSIIANNGTFKGRIEATEGIFTGELRGATGTFTGTITATGGTIGRVSIESISDSTYSVSITSTNGTTFKNGQGSTILTAVVRQGATIISTGNTYQWYKDNVAISGATNQTLTVNASNVSTTAQYKCVVTRS